MSSCVGEVVATAAGVGVGVVAGVGDGPAAVGAADDVVVGAVAGTDADGTGEPPQAATSTRASNGSDRRVLDVMPSIRARRPAG